MEHAPSIMTCEYWFQGLTAAILTPVTMNAIGGHETLKVLNWRSDKTKIHANSSGAHWSHGSDSTSDFKAGYGYD